MLEDTELASTAAAAMARDDDDADDDNNNAVAPAVTSSSSSTPAASNKKEDYPDHTSPADKDSKPASKKKSKKKSPKSSSISSKTKASPNNNNNNNKKRTMMEMAQDAIVSLGDRTGSSSIAISRFILQNYNLEDNKTFKSRLNAALKSAVKANKFQKVRNSYKLNAEYAKREREKKKKTSKKHKGALQQEEKKIAQQRQKELEDKMTPQQLLVLRDKQAKERQAQRKREEAEKLAKERQERIRRRRFPMEDTKLHLEDKELGVKPPADVTRRPNLPYFFHATLALDDPRRHGKTPANILNNSKVDHLEYGSRGLVPDLLQVYHFFRGDVHFQNDQDTPLVPEFTLNHLMFAVDEIINGNAKKSRLVPPLISHLFVTSLQLLTNQRNHDDDESTTVQERKLQEDLSKLSSALTPASWAEVCVLYMSTMERYYTSSASIDPNVLPCGKIDVPYLMRTTNVPEPMTPGVTKQSNEDLVEDVLPEGYCAYLGNPHGTLAIAHSKLQKLDPWNLRAEELMALLRALSDDILASSPDIAHDLARRDAEMYELLKAKRSADSHYRKIRLAYEGPKNPSRNRANEGKKEAEAEAKESEDGASGKKKNAKGIKENGENTTSEQDEAAPKFKPTATKKQYESAARAQQKAHDAYEKGLRTLTARTEPVGYDRNFNSVYYFNHDPERLYVEMSKPASTADDDYLPPDMLLKKYAWHVIETKSMFELFTSSLDTRGKRESNLYDELVGPAGGHNSLKRGLYDDLKEQSDQAARLRQREDLNRRLENAKIACLAEEENGRRSDRLQSKAQIDLAEIESKIEKLEKRIASDSAPVEFDYEELTGLKMLAKFEKGGGRRQTRRAHEKREAKESNELHDMPCTKLIPTGDIDGTGLVGLVVSRMLELEETCQALSPWERNDMSRASWIADLEERAHAWSSSVEVVVGPTNDDTSHGGYNAFDTPSSSSKRSSRTPASLGSAGSKRRRLDDGSPASTSSSSYASPSQILAQLKTPLLDLEERVYQFTGLALAAQDADEADDNMSASSEDKLSRQEEKKKLAWKKKVHSLRTMDGRMHVQVRDAVVEAITAARKTHFSSIVTKLRSALLLHQPHAAGECKDAAIAVLDSHGGYHEEDVDVSDDESVADEEMAEEEEEVPSALPVEAMALTGNLGGDDDADRVDWINAVKGSKTFSRWAALASSFLDNAETLIDKTVGESDNLRDSLKIWGKEASGKPKAPGKKRGKGGDDEEFDPTQVWANVQYTEDIVMAKADDHPYWPGRKCEAKDEKLASSLHSVGRSLVSLIGENGGLRAVRLEEIRPFDGSVIEDEGLEEASKNVRNQLDECMVVARRIVRGRKKSSTGEFSEEKKVAM